MMISEFEDIMDIKVDPKIYYDIIEPMYMALDVDKREFCKMINKDYFALPTKESLEKKIVYYGKQIREKTINNKPNLEISIDKFNEVINKYCLAFKCSSYIRCMQYTSYRLPYAVVFSYQNTSYEEVINIFKR